MPFGTLYLIFLAFAALVSVAMWLDYFRQIDVFEKEGIFPMLVALFIGGCTPYLSLEVYSILDKLDFTEKGLFVNDAFFSILGIGLNEELSKLAGITIVFRLLRKQINEPIDFLIYAGITALGFSLVENFNYFYNHGLRIISSRTFYSGLEHIINSTIIIYGILRTNLFNKGNPILNTITGFVLAVLSHGLFDFFLTDTFFGILTPFLSLLIYLIGINFWVQMLNNANNFSSFFDYHKINFTPRLVYRLFYWYLLTLIIAFCNNFTIAGFKFSILNLAEGLLSDGLLFWIVILRVSRFKIFKMKYFKVKPVLPFYITKNNDEDFKVPLLNLRIKIRGENFQEHLLTKYLNRRVDLHPVNEKNSFIKDTISVLISNKYLLFDDVIVYTIQGEQLQSAEGVIYVLKPRMGGIKEIGFRYPVEGLYCVKLEGKPGRLERIDHNKLKFLEWVYLKPDPHKGLING
ncbi:hypothetical protein CNR22_22580 [Sphingobacteriaceae bacterium]|nr:hypothetical protein CNR22_22580 [Sphingobacteriaceae bacterium]